MAPRGRDAAERWMSQHHGVITRRRALTLGMGEGHVDGLVRRSTWLAIHPGVYAAAASPGGAIRDLTAAVACAGPGAAASHLSAAWLLDLVDQPPPRPQVTALHASRRTVEGAEVRRSRQVPTTVVDGIACTTAARTVADCAALVGPNLLSLLVDRAITRPPGRPGAASLPQLRDAVRHGDRRPGGAALGALLAREPYDLPPPASVLEAAHLRCIESAGLPAPAREHPVRAGDGRYRLDTAWPELRLASEVDGHAWHSSPAQVARDTRRRNGISRAGWRLLVFTWRDVIHHPAAVQAEMRASYDAARDAACDRPA